MANRNRAKGVDLSLHLTEEEVLGILVALGLRYTDLNASAEERSQIRPTMDYLEEKLRRHRK